MGLVTRQPRSTPVAAWMPPTGVELIDRNSTAQSLPETVQVLRPPGTWTVPGASGPTSAGAMNGPGGLKKWRRRESNPRPVMF